MAVEGRDERTARSRLRLLRVAFALALTVMAVRLVDLALEPELGAEAAVPVMVDTRFPVGRRAEIVDRNGVLLATDYPKVSVFADPLEVIDPAASAGRLAGALRGVEVDALRAMLERPRRFVWIKRHIAEDEQRAVVRLGLPGIKFRTEHHRVYPQGRLTSHVVGFVGVENQALAGIERSFEQRLRRAGATAPLALTIDVRVQEIVRSALADAVDRFQAKGGSALVVEAGSGEVLAMVSLPDFDPNRVEGTAGEARFNRNTQGTYELGSLFKLFTVARALDAGIVDISGGLDASEPFVLGRHRIHDFHAKRRWLSVPEIIAFSSNIGAAKLAHALGGDDLKTYFQTLDLLDRHHIRLPEVGAPQVPDPWRPINTVTAAYGHGIAVSPLQAVDALASLLCGPRTLSHLVSDHAPAERAAPVVRPEVGMMLRWLMWLTVAEGTGKGARVPGYLVGGKTGSADQAGPGGYRDGVLLSSFLGAFPMDAPRFVVLVTLDDPEGDAATHFQAHGGWTAAPTVGRIIERIGPLLGIRPTGLEEERWFRDRLSTGQVFSPRHGRDEASYAVPKTASFQPPERGTGSCACRPCLSPG
jgi:cell division protein FtsI (penicillin-binding protein 3)